MKANSLGILVAAVPTIPPPALPAAVAVSPTRILTRCTSLLFLFLFLGSIGVFALAGIQLTGYHLEGREVASLIPISMLGVGYWVGNIFMFDQKLEGGGFSKHQYAVLSLYILWTPLAWINLISTRRSVYELAIFAGGMRTMIGWWLTASLLNDSFYPSLQQLKGVVLSVAISVMWDVALLLVFAQ